MSLPKAKELVSANPVIVFSKSHCPFCVSVKKLLTEIGASYKVVELDAEALFIDEKVTILVIGYSPTKNFEKDFNCFDDYEGDGSQIQDALLEWTGQRTVPNVFIGGNHIGGCDATTALHRDGKLVPLLTEAGAVAKSSA